MKKLLFAAFLFSACNHTETVKLPTLLIDKDSSVDYYQERLRQIYLNGYISGQLECLRGSIITSLNDSLANYHFKEFTK